MSTSLLTALLAEAMSVPRSHFHTSLRGSGCSSRPFQPFPFVKLQQTFLSCSFSAGVEMCAFVFSLKSDQPEINGCVRIGVCWLNYHQPLHGGGEAGGGEAVTKTRTLMRRWLNYSKLYQHRCVIVTKLCLNFNITV